LDFPPDEAPVVILVAALRSNMRTFRRLRTRDSEWKDAKWLNLTGA
jgi:hypothetical protein